MLSEPRSPITIFRGDITAMVQVLAITSDLFLESRIEELAKSLGANATVVKAETDLLREARSRKPSVVILDLTAEDYDPFSSAQKLKAMEAPPKILAVFPHIRADLKQRAEKMKIDYIIPNSSFLKTLKIVLEKETRDK